MTMTDDRPPAIPCKEDPEAWFPNDSSNQLGQRIAAEAAYVCQMRCPILAQCRALAEQIRPTYGVWAGKDWGAA